MKSNLKHSVFIYMVNVFRLGSFHVSLRIKNGKLTLTNSMSVIFTAYLILFFIEIVFIFKSIILFYVERGPGCFE